MAQAPVSVSIVTDPFAIDFGLKTVRLPWEPNKTVLDYAREAWGVETDLYAYINLKEVLDLNTLPEPGDKIGLAEGLAGRGGLRMAIMLAATIAATAFIGPAAGAAFLGANAPATAATIAISNIISGVTSAAVIAGTSIIVNALLPGPPKMGNAGPDNSRAYQFGDVGPTSEEMIPIKIAFGRIRIRPNLIMARSETRNRQTSGISIQDTLYMLWGVTDNEIEDIEEIYINGMAVSTFGASDISAYYTKGEPSQYPIYALSIDANGVYLFEDGGTPAPAPAGRYLFPSIVVETVPNEPLEDPIHCLDMTDSTENIYTPGSVQSQPLDKSIKLATALTDASTTVEFKIEENALEDWELWHGTPFSLDAAGYIKLYRDDAELPKDTIRYSGLTMDSAPDVDGFYYGTCTIETRTATNKTIGTTYTITPEYSYNNTHLIFLEVDVTAKPTKVPTGTHSDSTCEWQPNNYTLDTVAWYRYESSRTDTEDIVFQLTFPQGLIRYTHHGKEATRWVSFEFVVEQWNAAQTVKYADTKFVSPDDAESVTSPFGHADLPEKLWVHEAYRRAFAVNISAVDVLNEIDKTAAAWTTPSGTWLEVDGTTGYLPVGDGTQYSYVFKIRKHGHGAKAENIWFSTVNPDKTGGYTDIDTCHVYRVQEFNYNELLSYPHMHTVGLVINSTDAIGNRLPDVEILSTFKVKNYTESSSEDKYDLSTWPEEFGDSSNEVGRNPAWICLTTAWHSRWGAGIGGYESSATKASKFAAKVNIDKWVEFATFCETNRILADVSVPGYTFDGEIDFFGSFWKFCETICRVARARPVRDGNKLSVIWEQPYDATDNPITQSFNASEFSSFTETYMSSVNRAHAIEAAFRDKEDSYAMSSMVWIDPNVTNPNPNKIDSVKLIGLVEDFRVQDYIKYGLSKTRNIKRLIVGTLDTQAIDAQPGDLIKVQSEFVEWGGAEGENPKGGRITDVDSSGLIYLDRIVEAPTGTAAILVKTQSGVLYTKTVAVGGWDNTDSSGVTILTVTDNIGLNEMTLHDPFIVGQSSYVAKIFTLSKVEVREDHTTYIEAFEYSADPFGDLDIFSISVTGRPEIDQAGYTIRNLDLTQVQEPSPHINVKWDRPNAFAGQDHDYPLVGYMVYRKINDGAYAFMARTDNEEFIDKNLAPGDTYYYKITTVISINGRNGSTPIDWCTAAIAGSAVDDGIAFKYQFLETLEAPTFSYDVTPNRKNNTQVDLTVKITDPDDWWRKDRREGYQVWTRMSPTNDESNWLGPTGITLSSAASAGAGTIAVSSVTGLSIPGLVWVDNRDLVYVASNSGTTLTLSVTDTDRRFALSFDHASGVSIKNAHKGFFPIVYFGLQDGIASLAEESRVINLTTFYRAQYSSATGLVSVSSASDLSLLNPEVYLYRYIQGKTYAVGQIQRFGSTSIVLDQSGGGYYPIRADWSINMAYRDITGEKNKLYYLMWETPTSAPIMLGADGEIYATINGLPKTGYGWFGCNRLYYNYARDGANYGWISHIKVQT